MILKTFLGVSATSFASCPYSPLRSSRVSRATPDYPHGRYLATLTAPLGTHFVPLRIPYAGNGLRKKLLLFKTNFFKIFSLKKIYTKTLQQELKDKLNQAVEEVCKQI